MNINFNLIFKTTVTKEIKEVRANRNITNMVLLTSSLTIIGNSPRCVQSIVKHFLGGTLFVSNIVTILIYFTATSLNIFVNICFNKIYRSVLISYITRLFFFTKKK